MKICIAGIFMGYYFAVQGNYFDFKALPGAIGLNKSDMDKSFG